MQAKFVQQQLSERLIRRHLEWFPCSPSWWWGQRLIQLSERPTEWLTERSLR
jgi:hypothetical protein